MTGEVVEDGEEGELVFTTLTKEGMPMIRYRTRDLTRLMPGTARTMRRMEKITGRSDDMIILRGVNVFPTQIEEQVVATGGLAPHFQIELYKSGRMDAMRVYVEANADAADSLSKTAAARMLTKHIKDMVGVRPKLLLATPVMWRARRAKRCVFSTTGTRSKIWPARSQKTTTKSVIRF